jgi:hypothetical protein
VGCTAPKPVPSARFSEYDSMLKITNSLFFFDDINIIKTASKLIHKKLAIYKYFGR